MPCVYFRPVTDPKRKATTGVVGYCAGYSEQKLRIPSLAEYQKHCSTNEQTGCSVFNFRTKRKLPDVTVKTVPEPKVETVE